MIQQEVKLRNSSVVIRKQYNEGCTIPSCYATNDQSLSPLSLPLLVSCMCVRERERDIKVQDFKIINNILSKFETIYNGSLY